MLRYYKYTLCWGTGRIFHCFATNTVDIANYVEEVLSLRYDKAIVSKHEITSDDTCNQNVVTIQNGYANVITLDIKKERFAAVKNEVVSVWAKVH